MFGWLSRLARRGRTEIGGVAGFGKVPALGDFVRSQPHSNEMTAFEAWITAAMAHGEAKRNAAWRDDLAEAKTLAFVWGGSAQSKERGLFVGVVRPSQDAVRRAFPIVIGVPLPVASLVAAPHLAPLLLTDFFHDAARAAASAASARSQAEFQAAVAGVRPPTLEGTEAVGATYASWTKATRARELMGALFATDDEAQPEYAVHTIVDATHPYRGREAPPLSLGVRAPIGEHADAVAALWINMVCSAAGWSATVPTVFWPLDGASILVQLGVEAPPSVLVDLWAPSPQSNTVCELAAPSAPPSRFSAPLPPTAAAALASPESTLASVLAGLSG